MRSIYLTLPLLLTLAACKVSDGPSTIKRQISIRIRRNLPFKMPRLFNVLRRPNFEERIKKDG